MFRATTISLFSILFSIPAFAQISPDGTLSTTVSAPDGKNFTINNGNQLEGNLFHSFRDFSVPTDGSAFFNNAAEIANIFSRVTGGNPSNIYGLLRANGSANLFLLNPAGIIFGPNARLNIGGSFLGSTADSILFPDGEFSATDLDNPPLLTINAPIGLNFRDNPGDIVNRSSVQNVTGDDVGLEVASGKNLTLVGGRVVNEGGTMTAPDGKIFLGGLATAGMVALDDAFNPNFPENSIRADVLINNDAFLNVRAEGRGTINLIGNNIEISDAEIITGVNVELGNQEIEPGLFNIDATDTVSINNDSFISTATLGPGNGGDIIINAGNNLKIDDSFLGTGAFKETPAVVGKAGNIKILTNLVEINNQSTLSTLTDGEGNAGDVNIQANSFSLNNGSGIVNTTQGTGNAGNIKVEVDFLFLNDGGVLQSTTEGEGNAGNINVNASDSITLSDTAPVKVINGFPGGFSSSFLSSSEAAATGQGGTVTVTTDRLQISDGAVVGARTRNTGSGGNIIVNANTLEITGGGQILTTAFAEGNAGNITLNISEEINISGSDPTFFNRREQVIELANQINTGQIADLEQTIDPVSPESGIFANNGSNSTGDAGSININGLKEGDNSAQFLLPQLTLSNNGQISVASQGEGNAGNVNITANSIDLNNGSISASTNAGDEGNITLNIDENLTMRDDSLISAKAASDAQGGNIKINSQFVIAYPSQPEGNDIIANAVNGPGGDIDITAESLLNIQERSADPGNGTNDIDASSQFGLDGEVSINNPDNNRLQEGTPEPKIVESETLGVNACSGRGATEGSTFIVKGKGGVPRKPTERFTADALIPDGKPITKDKETDLTSLLVGEIETEQRDANYDPNYIPAHIKPIKTSRGDIYPARGIIKTKDGRIILTRYPTDNTTQRTPNIRANCTGS